MCGIIANFNIKDDKPVNEEILLQFEDQFDRGTKGFGIINIKKTGKYEVIRSTEPIKMIMDLRSNPSGMIVMHHRWPTSSKNKIQQTHPIEVDNGSLSYKYLFVHNGVVSNDDELRAEHEKLGFIYTTISKTNETDEEFNDSECLAIEVARFLEKQIPIINVQNYLAFICLQISRKTNKIKNIFFARNTGGALNLARDERRILITSEGKGHAIDSDVIYRFNLKDFEMKKVKAIYKESTYDHSSWDSDFYQNRRKSAAGFNTLNEQNDKKYIGDFSSDSADEDFEKDSMDYEIDEIMEELKDKTIDDMIDLLSAKLKDPEQVFLINPMDEIRNFILEMKEAINKCQELQITLFNKPIPKEEEKEESSLYLEGISKKKS